MTVLKKISLWFELPLSFQWKVIAVISKLLYWLGYISLIGPSRAIEIKNKSAVAKGELADFPLFFVLVSETAVRAGLFLIIGRSIELLMSDSLFEMYHLDYFLGILMLAGCVHLIAYYVGLVVISPGNFNYGMKFYRLGRNLAYAVLPAIVTEIAVLLLQCYQQIELFSGTQAQFSFYFVYFLFVLIGVIEAFLMPGKAMNLGNIAIHK